MSRDERIVQSMTRLTAMLVRDVDVAEQLTCVADRCLDALDAAAAAVMIPDETGELRVAASSSEEQRVLDLFRHHTRDGLGRACLARGTEVVCSAADAPDERWPAFALRLRTAGFGAAHATPLRWRGSAIGVLVVLHAEPMSSPTGDAAVAQALADVATLAIVHHRVATAASAPEIQLREALAARVAVEHATGMLAAQHDVGVEQAFLALRAHARRSGRELVDVAAELVHGGPSGLLAVRMRTVGTEHR